MESNFLKVTREASRSLAAARSCRVNERDVACGGFAAEYYLLRAGDVDGFDVNDPDVVAAVSATVFSNAWRDRQEFAPAYRH
jgi:hypothetical protein